MRQRLDDRAGIRQPVREAEVLEHRTARVPRGMQNPNRAKVGMCDERVCDCKEPDKIYASGWCVWHWPTLRKEGLSRVWLVCGLARLR